MNPEVETNEFADQTLDSTQPESPPDRGGEAISDAGMAEPEVKHGESNETPTVAEVKTPEQQIADLQSEVAEWKDRALRRQAEAENVKKVAFKEKMEVRKYAMRGFVEDMLRVADTFKLALGTATEDKESISESHKNLLSGIDMTFKELLQVFERHGVVEIKAEPGLVFDPSLHEAIGRVPSDKPVDTIVEVARPGWKMGDYVLRGAMVAVSAGTEQEESVDTSEGPDEKPERESESSSVDSTEQS